MYIMCNNYDDVILLGNINYPGQGGYVYAYVFVSLSVSRITQKVLDEF